MAYTVYAEYPDALGPASDVTDADIERYNALLAAEVQRAGLDGECKVIVSRDAGRFTLFDSRTWLPDGLREAIAAAWERFCKGE